MSIVPLRRIVSPKVVRASVVSVGVAVIAFTTFAVAGLVGARTGHATLIWVVAALGVAVVVPLLAGPLERIGERVAYGRQGNPYATLDAFVRRTAETLPTEDVLPQLARTAAVATRSTRGEVRLWLADGAEWVQTWPPRATDATDEMSVPLRHGGEDLGTLEVARAGRGSDPIDGAVLDRLAGPAGLALSNVRLTLDLTHRVETTTRLVEALRISRGRLVTARADQAERFARQVHREVLDRISTADAALAALGTTTTQMPPRAAETASGDSTGVDPTGADSTPADSARADSARAVLGTARDEIAVALESLREISHGIYPPVLHQRGLRAALEWRRDHAGVPWRIVVEPDGDWRVEAEVEAAAYFACVDLLSPAPSAADLVVTWSAPGALVMRIAGLPDASEEHTRLVRDRAEALGGSLEVDDGTASATIRLPARMIGG